MMLSTVAMAANNTVKVYEYDPTIGSDLNGINDDKPGTDRSGWTNLNLSGITPIELRNASEVFSLNGSGTRPQAMVIEGWFIPQSDLSNFTITHDDGIKVFIYNREGSEVFSRTDKWILTSSTTTTFDVELLKNSVHKIRVEYFDWGGDEVLKTNLNTQYFYDEIPSYTVTYYDGEEIIGSEEVKHGLSAVGINTLRTGFEFNGWTLDGESYVLESPVYGVV
jgi:hypothetical protein